MADNPADTLTATETPAVASLASLIEKQAQTGKDVSNLRSEVKAFGEKMQADLKEISSKTLTAEQLSRVENSRIDQDKYDALLAKYNESCERFEKGSQEILTLLSAHVQLSNQDAGESKHEVARTKGSAIDRDFLVLSLAAMSDPGTEEYAYAYKKLTENPGTYQKHINSYTKAFEEGRVSKYTHSLFSNVQNPYAQKNSGAIFSNVSQQAGILIPPEYSSIIFHMITEVTPILQWCRKVRTGSNEYNQPIRTNIPTAYWVNEGNQPTNSAANYTNKKYAPEGLAAEILFSNKMLIASPYNVEADVLQGAMLGFQSAIGKAAVYGGGVDMPLGFNTDPQVQRMTSSVSNSFSGGDILQMVGQLKDPYQSNGVFFMNRRTLQAIRTLVDDIGNFIWGGVGQADSGMSLGSTQSKITDTLNGRPICADFIDLPDVQGGATPIYYADMPAFYTMVELDSLRITRDPYTMASSDIVKYSMFMYIDGRVTMYEAGVGLSCKS